jgi:hypothetical protein
MRRILSTSPVGIGAAIVAGVVTLGPATARAHFSLDTPACFMTQDATGFPQKGAPCGPPDSPAGTLTMKVTAYTPGQTIMVHVTPTIPHPGWYRIALVTGKSSSQTATSLPNPPGTTCNPPKVTNPVWSPTQPVIADNLPSLSTPQTFSVKLPDGVTCTTAQPCTLQVVMVMTDHTYPSCYYHHCADITIGGGDGGTAPADAGGGSGGSTSVDASRDSAVASDSGMASSGAGGSSGAGVTTTGSSGGSGGTQVGGTGGSSSGAGGDGTTSSSSSTSGTASTTSTEATGGAATTTASTTSAGGATGTSGLAAPTDDPAGCSCTVPGRRSNVPWAAGTGLSLGLALALRRRRERATADARRPSR